MQIYSSIVDSQERIRKYVKAFGTRWLEEVGYNSHFRYFDAPPPARWDKLDNHVMTVITFEESTPTGYAHLDKDATGRVWLGVAVFPDYQGLGRGSEICCYLLDVARQKEIPEVWLSVDCDNNAAIAMYKSLEFKPINTFMKKVFDSPKTPV